jgi:hypothetical protein
MLVSKFRFCCFFIVVLVLLPPLGFYLALPWVYISYSDKAVGDLRVRVNTHDRIARWWLSPGATLPEYGHIFPDDDFFMQLDWYFADERRRCVGIRPKWPSTHVHIGADGQIDMSAEGATDLDQLEPCPYP